MAALSASGNELVGLGSRLCVKVSSTCKVQRPSLRSSHPEETLHRNSGASEANPTVPAQVNSLLTYIH